MSTLATDTYAAGIPQTPVYAGGIAATAQTAVSWPAIFAGAAAAAALSLILLILGVGLGLSSVSPWSGDGVSAGTFGFSTIAWLTFTQLAASGLGGYLAGRLRTKWTAVHGDEVYFRDTAHGFLSWAIATLVTATLLASAIGTVVGGGLKAGAAVAGGIGSAATAATAAGAAGAGAEAAKSDDGNSMGYFVDSMFRKPDTSATPNTDGSGSLVMSAAAVGQSPAQSAGEVSRILANSIANGSLAPEDQHYLGTLVAQRAGISQQDAEKRVTDTFNKVQAKLQDAKNAAKDAADKARKASSFAALWLFISMLFGAFVASLLATFGGRQRDLY